MKSNKPQNYFNLDEENRIIDAIRNAEALTSGEIRVHISQKKDADALQTTRLLFHELRMFNTRNRNAVLLHIAMNSKSFAIYGDQGIHQVVPDDFWENTKNIMQNHFKQGNFVTGICEGVISIGKQLKIHFPWTESDENQLPDNITYD